MMGSMEKAKYCLPLAKHSREHFKIDSSKGKELPKKEMKQL
jgi:hypothetical protein